MWSFRAQHCGFTPRDACTWEVQTVETQIIQPGVEWFVRYRTRICCTAVTRVCEFRLVAWGIELRQQDLRSSRRSIVAPTSTLTVQRVDNITHADELIEQFRFGTFLHVLDVAHAGERVIRCRRRDAMPGRLAWCALVCKAMACSLRMQICPNLRASDIH